MSTITTSESTADLVTLAEQINAAHADTLTAARTTLEHARRVGALLIQAKAAVEHGGWLPWLKSHVPFSVATAGRYVNIAKNWDRLNSSSVTNLTGAAAVLSGQVLEELHTEADGDELHRLFTAPRNSIDEILLDSHYRDPPAPKRSRKPSRTTQLARTVTRMVRMAMGRASFPGGLENEYRNPRIASRASRA